MTLNSSNTLSTKSCAAVATLFVLLALGVNCGKLILPYLATSGIVLSCIAALAFLIRLCGRHEKLGLQLIVAALAAVSLAVTGLWIKAATVGLSPDHITPSPFCSAFAVFAVILVAACCAVHMKEGLRHQKVTVLDRFAAFSMVYVLGNLAMLVVVNACLSGK